MCQESGIHLAADQVLHTVERLREELNDTFNKFGMKSPLVLRKSQELDDMLNRYNGIHIKENNEEVSQCQI